ncbi:MAG: hypothetical protein K2P88_03530 [Chitinophagaceae bacterium]|nr:hypothetical protein [Chitinophagaceae bacterium]
MKFDRLKYKQTRQEIINLIKQTHAWEIDEGFIADGIICPDIYEKEELKILVILAESYGYSHSQIVCIEEQPNEDFMGVGNPKVQTPKKIAALLWLLFKSIEHGQEIEWRDFPEFLQTSDNNYTELQYALSKIAWINIKKASKIIDDEDNNTTRLDYQEIYNAGTRNKNIIELQIDSIAPDLIIVFSNPVIHCLYDNKILGDGIDRHTKYKIQINSAGQKIIYMNHPSYLADWGYERIYETFRILYKGLCDNTNTTHNIGITDSGVGRSNNGQG